MKRFIFWDITLCSPLKVNQRLGGTCRFRLLATCSHSGFVLDSFSTLKMEAMYSSKTSVDFQRTTRRFSPEYRILQINFPLGSWVSVRAIAQAVSRRLPTAEAWVRAQFRSYVTCGGQSGTGAGFLWVLRCPLTILIPPTAPVIIYHQGLIQLAN
jgi:hypothetical protein